MSKFRRVAVVVLALLSVSAPARRSDVGHMLPQLTQAVTTTAKQRDVIRRLSEPLTYSPEAGTLDATNVADPRNFDIAGVRLGMTVEESRSALRAAGYANTGSNDDQLSYASAVMLEWLNQFGVAGYVEERVPHEQVWWRDREHIEVWFLALPEGPVVSQVITGQ